MSEKRKKYDWLYIIADYSLDKDFNSYIKKHNSISLKRAARAFVLHKKIAYKFPCYEVGSLRNKDKYFADLANDHSWIED